MATETLSYSQLGDQLSWPLGTEPKEGDSTTDGLSSRCRQGQWANSRSAAAFLFSLIAGSLGLSRPRGGAETQPVAGRSPWIYGAGFCVFALRSGPLPTAFA